MPPGFCTGVLVDGACWRLSEAGESCEALCGSRAHINATALAANASSAAVVHALMETHGLQGARTAALGVWCGERTPERWSEREEAAYLYYEALQSWDCYAGQGPDRVAPGFRSPCLCREPPPAQLYSSVVLGCIIGLCLWLVVGGLGLLTDALATALSTCCGGGSAAIDDASWRLHLLLSTALQATDQLVRVALLWQSSKDMLSLFDGTTSGSYVAGSALIYAVALLGAADVASRADEPLLAPALGQQVCVEATGEPGTVLEARGPPLLLSCLGPGGPRGALRMFRIGSPPGRIQHGAAGQQCAADGAARAHTPPPSPPPPPSLPPRPPHRLPPPTRLPQPDGVSNGRVSAFAIAKPEPGSAEAVASTADPYYDPAYSSDALPEASAHQLQRWFTSRELGWPTAALDASIPPPAAALIGLCGVAAPIAALPSLCRRRTAIDMAPAAALALKPPLKSPLEPPSFGLLRALHTVLEVAPHVYFQAALVATLGVAHALREHPLLLLGMATGALSAVTSAAHLLTSPATPPPLRVRDELTRSVLVRALVVTYVGSDLLLRGLACAVLGTALGPALGPCLLVGSASWLLATCRQRAADRDGCCAASAASCVWLLRPRLLLSVLVAATAELAAPPLLEPQTERSRRRSMLRATTAECLLTLLGLSSAMPLPHRDPEWVEDVMVALCAALVLKYLSFAIGVSPAMARRPLPTGCRLLLLPHAEEEEERAAACDGYAELADGHSA